MSGAYLIAIGGRAPEELQANRALHQDLIDDLNAEAAAQGWAGAAFERYGRTDNYVSIEVVPGSAPLTLDALRAFREQQRQVRERMPQEQGDMLHG